MLHLEIILCKAALNIYIYQLKFIYVYVLVYIFLYKKDLYNYSLDFDMGLWVYLISSDATKMS